MGAFDCELSALGFGRGSRPRASREEPVYVEPEMGARVMAYDFVDRLPGTVVYCSEETVVVRFDRPHKGEWATRRERSYYRPNTNFLAAPDRSIGREGKA